ncbi:4-hydroxy-tetrahydrodipicolinate synthase [Myxococcota bacterium]|nr:4-hydroxy-tetrahydrodipicolinate synthase [Myxococcota bacterium]
MKLQGSIVALVTPFHNEQICWNSFERLVSFHRKNGTHGILVAGTTGEAATLSLEEYSQLLKTARELVGPSFPLLAGTGSFSTKATMERTALAAELGADVALVVTPYYNKPTQSWLVKHFTAVADSAPIPVLLYNVPSRTGVNMLPPAVLELAGHPNIIGVKEASGSCGQAADILKYAPDDFILLSGDDKINYPLMAMGAKGAISVVANVVPGPFSAFMEASLAGDSQAALSAYYSLLELCDALFIETNPAPTKAALHAMGLISSPELRSPLFAANPATSGKISAILTELKVL